VSVRGSSSIRHAVLGAYRSLIQGDAQPLVELLAADVEWSEQDRARAMTGRTEVGELIERCAANGAPAVVQGIVVRRNAFVLQFRRPWWAEQPRRRTLKRGYAQTVSFGREIERIECSSAWRRTGLS
jgi:hypothetical protein